VPDEYLSQTDLARELDVARATVAVWRGRYPDFPKPDVMVGDVPGWRKERLTEIRAWLTTRPGQGAGGGRPRKDG
jgi:hypothetical protein